MSAFVESDLEFDFTASPYAVKHDAVNQVFPGVDFIVDEITRWLWLEVKNWEGSSVPARRRGGQRRSFLAKLNSKTYFTDTLRAKFTGTAAYLALTNAHPSKEILYVALLESPRMDSALMLRANDRLNQLVKRDKIWHIPVNAAVMNLAEWQTRFPIYPTRAI